MPFKFNVLLFLGLLPVISLGFAVSELSAQSHGTTAASGLGASNAAGSKANPSSASTGGGAMGREASGSETTAKPVAQRARRCMGAETACATGKTPKHIVHSSNLRPGATLSGHELHRITRPGLYGIGKSPRGSSYGIVDGQLLRYDPDTMQILSVIRNVDSILD